MVSPVFAVTLFVTFLHLFTGLTFASVELGDNSDGVSMTPDPPQHQSLQTPTSTSQSLRELIHAALFSKDDLGQAPLSAGMMILYPSQPSTGNHSSSNSSLNCMWLLEARKGHRLHLHFERFTLDED
ncbi:hypothetical protein AAFF_G00366760 [Aldrovandia affinis]|uniref:CUB domain-containing protein n=1 Tax=Aldrovandia affinis TaxID=143900 RepID=A0AAD7SHG7_9TELE|nr:hypothetical protein AAFF_G00366760 [Aldrovandia affinis]